MRHAAADDGSQVVAASRPADGTAPRAAGRPAETPFPSGVTTQRNSMFVVLVTTNEFMLDLYSLEASGLYNSDPSSLAHVGLTHTLSRPVRPRWMQL